MKKKALIGFSILIVLGLVLSSGAYGKYTDYKLGQDIKKIINAQNQKKESQVIQDYNVLLSKYENSSEVYLYLSNYYVSQHKLDKAIDALYSGLEKNMDNKMLTQALSNNIQNATLQEGYLIVTKGSKITSDNDKVTIKAKDGTSISLELVIEPTKVNTSKEGFTKLKVKEKYTGINVDIGIDVLEATGNTMSNNLIGGKMAFKDGWIYYRDPSSGGLYKMREDLSRKTLLDDTVKPSSINIKDNNLYFIDDKSGKYGSLVKTDLEGKNKQIIRQSSDYVYLVGDSIYYTEITGEYSGWRGISLNKMNFKYKDVEKKIHTNLGSIQVMNSKYIFSRNKRGTFISSKKDSYIWGGVDGLEKDLSSVEICKGELYGVMNYVAEGEKGFGKLDIEHNTQNITIENVQGFNISGNDVYYVKDDGIYMASIDGTNEVRLMDITVEPYEIKLYNMGDKMYSYSDEIKIVTRQKQGTDVKTGIHTINDKDIINICNDANKLLLDIQQKRKSDSIQIGDMFYSSLDEPYSSKQKIKDAMAKYFTKAYVKKFMEGQTFVEKDGNLYYMIGDSGVGASYTYTSIKSRNNKGQVIQAVSNAIYSDDDTTADNANIKLMVEDGEWKIDSFRSMLQ